MAAKQTMSLAEALETALLSLEWARDEFAGDDRTWRNNFQSAIKALSQHKANLESEIEMNSGTKKLPTSFKELQSNMKAEELTAKLPMLMNNIEASDLPDKPAAIDALTKEFSTLVQAAFNADAAKQLAERNKGEPPKNLMKNVLNLFPTANKEPEPKEGIDAFFTLPKQPKGFNNPFFTNGKGTHK